MKHFCIILWLIIGFVMAGCEPYPRDVNVIVNPPEQGDPEVVYVDGGVVTETVYVDGGKEVVYVDGGKEIVYVDGGKEVVYVDGGREIVYVESDAQPGGCQVDSDCDCQAPDAYVAECIDTVCYCTEIEDDPDLNRDVTITLDIINPTKLIQIEGESEVLSASYMVYGTTPTSPLNYLKVINQPGGEGASSEPTLAIRNVWVSCYPPSGMGHLIFHEGQLDENGVVEFKDLNCYKEDGTGFKLQLAYDVARYNDIGENLSGQVFRLVLDDHRLLDNHENVQTRTVRKSKPNFLNTSVGNLLLNGVQELYRFQVTAHQNGDVGMARLAFEVDGLDSDGGGELALSQFRFYRDGIWLLSARIFDHDVNDLTGSQPMQGNNVVVSFQEEEVIPAGVTLTYYLRATVSGVETDDTVKTWPLVDWDQTPVEGKTAQTTPNTAKLISLVASESLFSTLEFFQAGQGPDRNLVWSDHSAEVHVFDVAQSASSYDWTNGYRVIKSTEPLWAHTLEN